MNRRPAIVPVLALAAVLTGCGGGSSAPGPTDGLADYLPASSKAATVADFEGVKQQLGLDANAALPTYDRLNVDISLQKDRSAAADLYDAAAVTVAPLYDPATTDVVSLGGDRRRDALSRALDTRAITAAAANERRSADSITVVRTTQPFSELAKELSGDEYARDGNTLVPAKVGASALSDAGDGVIVFGLSASAAGQLAASPPGGPPEVVDLLGHAKDVVAAAGAGPAGGCLRAFGGWHDADGGEGVLRLELDAAADAADFDPGAIDLDGGLELASPDEDGDALEAAYTLERPENSVSPVDDLIHRVPLDRLYRCR